MASTLARSGLIPFSDTMWPNTLISGSANEHFGSLSVMPLVFRIVSSWSNCLRCVSPSLDHSQMLTEMLAQSGTSLMSSWIISWKCSPDGDAPIISLVNL